MDEVERILSLLISWPVVSIVSVFVLRQPIIKLVNRLVSSDSGRARIGPIEVELGRLAQEGQQAVSKLNRINELMAESRLLELEITEGNFGPVFTDEQRRRMMEHIDELRKLTDSANS